MFQFPDSSQITIRGPFWSADATVIRVAAAPGASVLPVDRFTAISPPGAAVVTPIASPLTDDTAGKTILGTTSAPVTAQVAGFAFPGVQDWSRYTYTGRLRVTAANGVARAVVFHRGESRYVLEGQAGQPFELRRVSGPSSNRLGQQSSVVFQPNVWFRFRIEIDARDTNDTRTRISIKIFRDGEAEPAGFQIAQTDNNPNNRLIAGSPGVSVQGPGNKFFADLRIEFPDNTDDRQALRRLFVDAAARTEDPQRDMFLPRTVIAVCAISRVRIDNRDTLTWTRTAPARDMSEADIPARLTTGDLNVFLLQGDSADFLTAAPGRTFTCLEGEIDLRRFQPAATAVTTLFAALRLEQGTTPAIFVHSSGISAVGGADLLWQTSRVRAAYTLRRFPARGLVPPTFRLFVEKDRLDSEQGANLVRAWQRLSEQVNPEFPLLKAGPSPTTWVTLEAPDLQSLPPVFWDFSRAPWDPQSPVIRFGLDGEA